MFKKSLLVLLLLFITPLSLAQLNNTDATTNDITDIQKEFPYFAGIATINSEISTIIDKIFTQYMENFPKTLAPTGSNMLNIHYLNTQDKQMHVTAD